MYPTQLIQNADLNVGQGKTTSDKRSMVKMRTFYWMSGMTRKTRIRNENIRANLGIAPPIQYKMRENRFITRLITYIEELSRL